VTTSGDTQVLPRIPVPGSFTGPVPTVALTIAVTAPEAKQEPAPARAEQSPRDVAEDAGAAAAPAGESHERIYEEAMATIAALASNWSSAVQSSSGRHRAAA
jgi:hypothetical protein